MPYGKVVIETLLETKKFDKQIEKVKEEIYALEEAISKPKDYKMSSEDIKQAGLELEKLKNKYISLYQQREKIGQQQLPKEFIPDIKTETESEEVKGLISELNTLKNAYDNINRQEIWSNDDVDKLDKIESKIKETVQSLEELTGKKWQISGFEEVEKQAKKNNKSIDIGISKLKKFALSIFSVGSIFAVVSKASSAYLSQNEELANKLQSVWVGLGSFLEPVINGISQALLKGLGYLNEFVKALTGTDYIANANAKALEKQAKSQQKLNKATQQYDFDVIRTQQDTSSSTSSSGLPSGYIDIPELNQNVVNKLKELAGWLKENKDLIEKVGIALGVTFGAVAVGKLLKSIGSIIGVAGAGTGLAGLGTALLAIAAVFTVTLAIQGAVEVKKQVDELNESLDKNTSQIKTNTDNAKDLSNKYWNLIDSGKATENQINALIDVTSRRSTSIANEIKELENQKNWLGDITGSNKKLTEQQEKLKEELDLTNENYKKLYEQGLLNDDQVEDYTTNLETQMEVMSDLGYDVSDLKKQYQKLTGHPYKLKLETTEAYNKSLTLWDRIRNIFKKPILSTIRFSSSGSGHGGSGRAFAQGGIVTQPTRALIGEAGYNEYVLPEREDYLSRLASLIGQYNSGGNPGVTNIYLNGRLIQREMSKTQQKIDFATNNN